MPLLFIATQPKCIKKSYREFSLCYNKFLCHRVNLTQHYCYRFGHLEVLKLLTEAGCSVDIKFSCSRTLLHEAAVHSHEGVANFLLDMGCKVCVHQMRHR